MVVKYVAEIILTSCLLWSRVWSRASNVCDGGRGDGDKWFDGCRWCVCQKSGPLCSSSECSHLVFMVPPCQKVDSRWWDGCYNCKCYHHGIECTVDDTCLLLMRSEPYGLDFLSHDACVNPQDGRCVCGVDGVPSCTAEVIDRNAHPITTIRLQPVFPAVSAMLSPRLVYYDRPFTNTRGIRTDTPNFYTDSLYINDPDEAVEKLRNRQLKRHLHSLVKRHATRKKKHSPQVDITKHRRSQNSKHKSARETHHSSSHNPSNSRKHFEGNLSGKGSQGRRKYQGADKNYVREDSNNVFGSDLIDSNYDDQFYPKKKRRESYTSNDIASNNNKMDRNVHKDRVKTFPSGKRQEFGKFIRLSGRNVDKKFQKRIVTLKEDPSEERFLNDGDVTEERFLNDGDVTEERFLNDGDVTEERFLNDGAVTENVMDSSSALLVVASGNRCRWGVRWYGGSLRCYCGVENSITCGDPSFVASNIDGFRVERASCEVGQIWDDPDSCRTCECQVRGVALCRRSPSCSLPFLIKPLPMDPDERKDEYGNRKDQSSIGHTDEFTGQEEHQIVYDKDTPITSQGADDKDGRENGEVDLEVDVSIDQESDNTTIVNISDGKIKNDGELEKPNLITGSENDSEKIGPQKSDEDIGSENGNVEVDSEGDSTDGGNNKKDNVLELDVIVVTYPDVILTQDDTSTAGDVNINLGQGDNNKKSQENVEDTTNNKLDVENKDYKRTTQKLLGDCMPSRRWLDGCKRCRCDDDGNKHCDDSRCLKPVTINPGLIMIPSPNVDRGSGRPIRRPPPEWFLPREGPISLQPPFLAMKLCGRFAVGEKYWDECNMCLCTSHGPKCTAKNCA